MIKSKKSLLFFGRIFDRISRNAYFLKNVCYRKTYDLKELHTKDKLSKGKQVDKAAIKKVWNGIYVDSIWSRYYNGIERETKGSFDARYIPLDMEACFIDDWFNNTNAAQAIDDKNMYDMYFHDVNMPKTVGRIINHSYFDENYLAISIDKLLERCLLAQHVIMKPSVGSMAGHGIVFWNEEEGIEVLKKLLLEHDNYIIQELIHQHDEINKIYSQCVNSIRIVTCHFKGKTEVLSAVIRIGQGGNKLDNASQGGLFCGINEDGTLKKYGYSKYGETCTVHPQGAVFSECRIPNFEKCKKLVIDLSNRFLRISKLISWDLAVDENGEPMLIEVNLCYGGTDIHQIANGPLFGDKTEDVVDCVFRKQKKYRVVNRLLSIYG